MHTASFWGGITLVLEGEYLIQNYAYLIVTQETNLRPALTPKAVTQLSGSQLNYGFLQ
jgi:hypothetical protein